MCVVRLFGGNSFPDEGVSRTHARSYSWLHRGPQTVKVLQNEFSTRQSPHLLSPPHVCVLYLVGFDAIFSYKKSCRKSLVKGLRGKRRSSNGFIGLHGRGFLYLPVPLVLHLTGPIIAGRICVLGSQCNGRRLLRWNEFVRVPKG